MLPPPMMQPVGNEPNPGILEAVDGGIIAADAEAEDAAKKAAREKEENQVKAILKDYNDARNFDMAARAQYAIDRRYAAGTAHLNWAVSANLIGSFIDILVSFLYARNPDVSVKKAPQVDNRGTKSQDDFAKTMELMISAIWKAPTSTLKPVCQKVVRSALSVGPGWMKAIVISKGTNIPAMKTQLNDSRNNIAQLVAEREQLASGDPTYGGEYQTPEEIDSKLLTIRELEASLADQLEVALRKALVADFVRAEDIQVSLDVSDLSDYKSANWIANAIYRTCADTIALFPDLTEADLKDAACYYQRTQRDLSPVSDYTKLTGLAGLANEMAAAEAENFVSDKSAIGTTSADQNQVEFYKVIERWNRVTGHIETIVEGVKKFAKQPYQPDYPSSRFYPYFLTMFYPVDGARHPQSLPWRLFKLLDEYNSARSSLRLTRDRAIPGTIFNSSGLETTEAEKIQRGVQQEFIGIKPVDPQAKIGDLFAPKPVASADMRLFDVATVVADMERMSGVQEALQSTVTTEKTATEAEIQQTGFASRTTADRDQLETMLTDLANYTGEIALKAFDIKDAQRMCGKKAFWPTGMSIDDLLTMVEIKIEAGTTGKPKAGQDKDTWATILPVAQSMMKEIQLATMTNNLPLANALSELLRETMARLGDETDPERFIPQMPTQPAIPGMAPGAGVPGDPGMDPMAAGAPPAGDGGGMGDLLAAPELTNPVIAPPA